MSTTRSFSTRVPKILLHPANDQGCGQYRVMVPASLMRRYGHAVTQAHPYGVTPESLAVLDPDVVVFQLFQTEKHQERIKAYRKALPHAHFVYEIDDLFWEVPADSIHQNNPLLPHAKSNIRVSAKLCNSITVTTEALADEMRKLTGMKDIRVVPNEVPRSFINAALAGRRSSAAIKSPRPRVGWVGGIGHKGDLKLVGELINRFGDEVQWVFMGMAPFGVQAGPNVEVHDGVPFNDYARRLGELNLDIALAPLEDVPFNHCKSDLRVLEYGAAGYPVIASDVGTYNNTPVIQIPNDPDIWEARIKELIDLPSLTSEQAEDLHEWVITKRCMDDHIGERVQALLPKDADRFIPMVNTGHMGEVVTVGAKFEGLRDFNSIAQAWVEAPGADILYARPNTVVSPPQAARMIQALGTNASAATLTNDGMYPSFGKFMRLSGERALQLDIAAQMADSQPIAAPFSGGPCILLSGAALARFGLPDETRFGDPEYAMADWGARCMEGGMGHITVCNTFIYTDKALVQQPESARKTLEHVSMWSPGFAQMLQSYQQGEALADVIENLELAFTAISHQALPANSYAEWFGLFNTVTDNDRLTIQEDVNSWHWTPKISIVMPVYNADPQHLREAIDSVLAQAYTNWELVIVDDCSTNVDTKRVIIEYAAKPDVRIKYTFREENGHICEASNTGLDHATGDWVFFLDHDDTLSPAATYFIAREIVQHPEVDYIYSDSDKISPTGDYMDPYLAPDFSYELLLAQNYVTHISAYPLDRVKELRFLKGMEGSQDWDLVLRYLDAYLGNPPDTTRIRHIPHVLYHWRQSENSTSLNVLAKPYALQAGRKAVMDHLHRTKQAAYVGPNNVVPIFNMVRFLVPEAAPSVTVIIPTKDNALQLARCLESVLVKTIYSNFNIVILDNANSPNGTMKLLQKLDKRGRSVTITHVPGEFNFAEFNNRAVAKAESEFVCLLNDDVEVIEPTWLLDMVGQAMRPKVGAVGAKLLYPDNTVQHGGIIFSPHQPPGRSALHLWQRQPANDPGQAARAVITQPVLAVTAACLVIRKATWDEVGGMDAVRFPVDWNDVDLGIRLHKAGYRNILCAEALMRHYEGQTKFKTGTWRLEHMLADEVKLIELHEDVSDPYIHPDLAFLPNMSRMLACPNPKPWHDDVRDRVLVINGGEKVCRQVYMNGKLPFGATLDGNHLVFTAPPMPNVRPIDLRGDTDELVTITRLLGIDNHVIFSGIGDGTLGSVGFMAALAKDIRVDYLPTEEAKTENDKQYYDPAGWRATWQQFYDAISAAN